MKIQKIFAALSGMILMGLIFSSCTNDLEVRQTANGTFFKYKTECGETFVKTIQSISGETETQLFKADEIKNLFSQTGVENIDVVETGKNGFILSGKLASDGSDMISKSEMLQVSDKGVRLLANKEKMQKLYGELPKDISYYVDLFMAPSFTGEKMSSEEYTDLIAAVYGQEMAEELNSSKVKVTLIRADGTTKKFTVPLVSILNLTGTLAFTN